MIKWLTLAIVLGGCNRIERGNNGAALEKAEQLATNCLASSNGLRCKEAAFAMEEFNVKRAGELMQRACTFTHDACACYQAAQLLDGRQVKNNGVCG